MSYVLDALKKSDQERQRRTTPGIHTLHATVEPRRKRRILWPCLLTLSALFNAGLLLWWLSPWQSGKQGLVVQGSPSPGLDVSKDKPGQEKTPDQVHLATQHSEQHDFNASKSEVSEIKPSFPIGAAPHEAEQGSTDVRPQAGAESSGTEGTGEIQDSRSKETKNIQDKLSSKADIKKAPDFVPDQAKQSPAAGRPVSSQAMKKDKPKLSKADPGPVKPKVPPENREAAPQDIPSTKKEAAKRGSERNSLEDSDYDSQKGVPQLSDLPLQMRHNVPALSFSMLVYSRNPAERVARVDGQVVKEGQELAADLKLESITPDGAIFNYRGYRFHKGVR